jgi:hypothetical protein
LIISNLMLKLRRSALLRNRSVKHPLGKGWWRPPRHSPPDRSMKRLPLLAFSAAMGIWALASIPAGDEASKLSGFLPYTRKGRALAYGAKKSLP